MTSGGNPATTPVPRSESWWIERHQAKIDEARRGNFDLLLVGDSITQNYEKPGPKPDEAFLPIWNELFAPHHAMNLGFSGDRTEHVLWRLQHGEIEGLSPKHVVLLIGTNNTAANQRADQVSAGIVAIVFEIERLMPRAHILILGILPSGISPEKSASDSRINEAVRVKYRGSAKIQLLTLDQLFVKDGSLDAALFYDPKLTPARAPLHPNAVGQRRMAEAVAAAIYGGSNSQR